MCFSYDIFVYILSYRKRNIFATSIMTRTQPVYETTIREEIDSTYTNWSSCQESSGTADSSGHKFIDDLHRTWHTHDSACEKKVIRNHASKYTTGSVLRNKTPDYFRSVRKNVSEVAFALDSDGTIDRDDAISFNADTRCFSVHITDVLRYFDLSKSSITVLRSALKKYVNFYLPGMRFSMFDADVSSSLLSLNGPWSDGSVISFSFRFNRTTGDVEPAPGDGVSMKLIKRLRCIYNSELEHILQRIPKSEEDALLQDMFSEIVGSYEKRFPRHWWTDEVDDDEYRVEPHSHPVCIQKKLRTLKARFMVKECMQHANTIAGIYCRRHDILAGFHLDGSHISLGHSVSRYFGVPYVRITNPIRSGCDLLNHVILKRAMLQLTDSTNENYQILFDAILNSKFPGRTSAFPYFQEWIATKHLWRDISDELDFYFKLMYINQRGIPQTIPCICVKTPDCTSTLVRIEDIGLEFCGNYVGRYPNRVEYGSQLHARVLLCNPETPEIIADLTDNIEY